MCTRTFTGVYKDTWGEVYKDTHVYTDMQGLPVMFERVRKRRLRRYKRYSERTFKGV